MDFWLDGEGIDEALPAVESIKRFVHAAMGVAIVPRMCVGSVGLMRLPNT